MKPDDPLELLELVLELADEELELDELTVLPPPDTCVPAEPDTDATTPETGARSTVSESVRFADASVA